MNDSIVERTHFFKDHIYADPGMWVAPFIVMALYCMSLVIVIVGRRRASKSPRSKLHIFAPVLIALWTIGPPLWFMLDYFYLVPSRPLDKLPDVEAFKHMQELARNVWLAALAILVGAYSGKPAGEE
ncbi:MAG: hypothetical protein JWR80_3856 [Bradyrhizobium sp.]|nr:hypothetical protein [Bradyrhizobium sp.]